ncbi:serine/threonine protein kinase, partial [Micromonospora wenchangensis]
MDPQPTTPADLRPCAHCGRDVPQRAGAGRPFRYCRDNDGACQRASRNSRMRHRNAPGLPGQVARTWEVVDRLDQVVETLTEALHAELSPAGVQRQLAQARADAAAEVAAAHTARDEAREGRETNPDDLPGMIAAAGVLTARG